MTDGRSEPATPRGRAVAVVVAIVALAGVGGFAVGGSSATQAGGSADWSPDPGKEVTPADNADDETETTTETEAETTTEVDCPPVDDSDDDDDNDEGYQLNVSYAGDWSGRVLTNESSTPIEGSGSEIIDLNVDKDEHVGVSVTKTDLNSDTLSIQLLYDGEVVDEQNRIRPDVTHFDSDADTSSFDSTSDTSSFDETTTDDWAAFGEDEESDAFGDDVFAQQEGDPFDENDTIAEECEPVEENDEDDTTTETTDDDSDFSIETDEEAQIVFADQTTREAGTNVVVESVTLPDGGLVVIYNTSMMDGDGSIEESVVGVSEKLDAQQSEDVEIDLAYELEESQTLVAVAYRDTDENGDFNFDNAGEAIDKAYVNDEGEAVGDDAYVRVPNDDDDDTPEDFETSASGADVFGDEESTTTDASAQSAEVFTDTDTSTATVTRTETTESDSTLNAQEGTSAPETPNTDMSGNAVEESTETNAPGFGVGVAIVATLGTALLVTRRQD